MPSTERIDAFTLPVLDASDAGDTVTALLGLEPVESAEVCFESDSLPVDLIADAVQAAGRSQGEALRARSTEQAHEILAQAEADVRDLLAQGLPDEDFQARSVEIVARAEHEVGHILAQARNDAEVVEIRASQRASEMQFEDEELDHLDRPVLEVLVPAAAVVEPNGVHAGGLVAVEQAPTHDGLRYRVAGEMTFATMLALQQTIARLPGVTAARLTPEPDDAASLEVDTADPTLVRPLLGSLHGLELHVEAP